MNETGVAPTQLDFYSNNVMKISVSINANDTSFVASELNDYRWMMPACHDSVIVKFGETVTKTRLSANDAGEPVAL